MKRRLIYCLFITILGIGLITFTGCDKKDDKQVVTSNKESEKEVKKSEEPVGEKAEFTELVSDDLLHVKYKLPKGYESKNTYKDQGKTVVINMDRYTTGVAFLHSYDDKADEIKKVKINGVTYEYFKFYNLDDWIIYIYRYEVNNDITYYFEFNVYAKEYDDAQIEKFMNTVEYK